MKALHKKTDCLKTKGRKEAYDFGVHELLTNMLEKYYTCQVISTIF